MCKVIENKMLEALREGRDMDSNNTRVINNSKGVFVKLYSTIIYAKVRGREYFSDGGYCTVTTSSRLRALGADYSTNEKKNNCLLRTRAQMNSLFITGRLHG